MPNYVYRARDQSGTLLSGKMDTSGRDAVASHLDSLGYFPVSISEERQSFHFNLGESLRQFQTIQPKEMIVFSRQLATLVGAGVPILSSFDSLIEQTPNPRLKEIIITLRKEVEGGSSFSDALSKHPKVFSNLYINMVRAGEAGGVLEEILDRLATLAEFEEETRGRIKTATRYPVIVFVVLFIAFGVLTVFVLPKFTSLYEGFNVSLPLPTRILIGIHTFVSQYGLLMLVLFAVAIAGIRKYIQTVKGRLLWDGLKLKLPVFGPIFSKVAFSRFARIFGTLSRSGLPILETLEIVSTTVGNAVVARVIENIRDAVSKGKGIVQTMRVSGVFPSTVIQMVAIGEESGQIETMLGKVSEYYDREVDYAIKNLSTSLEPILLIIIGGVILLLALGIFMPWWNMMELFKAGGR